MIVTPILPLSGVVTSWNVNEADGSVAVEPTALVSRQRY
jgi:hypothetical protein